MFLASLLVLLAEALPTCFHLTNFSDILLLYPQKNVLSLEKLVR
jgi:hypothetical protein